MCGGLRAGQKALVHGAAGGVGGFAVQLAKWKGARVIGTASARNQEFLRQLGADEAIDYAAVKFEESARDVDVVFDTIGGETQARSWQMLKKGGMLVSTVSPPSAEEAARRGVRQDMISVQPNANKLAEIAGLIDAGRSRSRRDGSAALGSAPRARDEPDRPHARQDRPAGRLLTLPLRWHELSPRRHNEHDATAV